MSILYLIVYYSAISFGVFISFFLLIKKRNIDGSLKGADWFYPIKYYYAKKEVKKFIQRSKCLLDGEINVSSVEESDRQTFYGVDQNDNSLSLSIAIGIDRIVEFRLCLRLSDGNTYVIPDDGYVHLTNLAKDQWRVGGLSIDVLEPHRRLRIIFNGLLKNIGRKGNENIEHVQFHFIFNSAASPVFVPQDLDENLLASSLASSTWKDNSWKNSLVDQNGFYQFGALQGFVKGEAYSTEKIINLATCRSKFNGRDDRQILKRSLTLFMVDKHGNLFNIVLRSLRNGCSQLNYGCVFLSSSHSVQLKSTDIQLEQVGKNKTFHQNYLIHIKTSGKVFRCVMDLEKGKRVLFQNSVDFIGYECFNFPSHCDVNSTIGRGIIEFSYEFEGYKIFLPKLRKTELPVKILPSVLVVDIRSKEAEILPLTGGKGNSLALLASLKSEEFIIPEGFIVTTNAYKLQVNSDKDIQNSIAILNDIYCQKIKGSREDASKEIVDMFKKSKLLPEIVDSIKTYFDKYHDNGIASWAVRSSAVGEDSEELSAAGQNETLLGCKTFDEVLKAIAACWASLYKSQSVTYRWQHGLSIASDMAVVVQKIVPSESAGVFFTCHPTTSNPAEMVITSNFGIGETVVSGDVDPDTYTLKRSWDNEIRIFEKLKGTKTKRLEIKGDSLEETPNENDDFSLNDKQVLQLARVGIFLDGVFGNHRDIEWAFYQDKLYLLQSRPITTLYTWTNYELTHELDYTLLTEQSIFTVANIREVMPNALTVLTYNTSVSTVDRAVQTMAQENYDPKSAKGVCTFQHSPFIDTVMSIHRNATKEITVSALIMDLALFGHPVLNEEINNIVMNRLSGPTTSLVLIQQTWKMVKASWQNAATVKRAKHLVDNLTFILDEGSSYEEMLRRIQENVDVISEVSLCHSKTTTVSIFYQIVALNVLLEGGKVLTPDHYTDFANILSSCKDVISAEVPLYLEKIATVIRDNFNGDIFCELNPEEGVDWINKKKILREVFEEFLNKHGHRSLNEFEVMEKSWREDQTKLIPMIQANVKYGNTSEKIHLSLDVIAKRLITPKKYFTRKILKFFMNKMQVAVGRREQTKSEFVRGIDKLRHGFRALARKMVSDGLIPKQELIYHLTPYEIKQLAESRNPNLVTKALRREKMYSTWCNYKYQEISYGAPIPEESITDGGKYNTVSYVTGTPVCSGSVKARACVIESLKEIDQLQKGDILITYSTDIGWSPYFPMISGIVTELGGLVSHGAVVAREYGLPSIVGVKDVTKYFKTGDIVILNGDKGRLGVAEQK